MHKNSVSLWTSSASFHLLTNIIFQTCNTFLFPLCNVSFSQHLKTFWHWGNQVMESSSCYFVFFTLMISEGRCNTWNVETMFVNRRNEADEMKQEVQTVFNEIKVKENIRIISYILKNKCSAILPSSYSRIKVRLHLWNKLLSESSVSVSLLCAVIPKQRHFPSI